MLQQPALVGTVVTLGSRGREKIAGFRAQIFQQLIRGFPRDCFAKKINEAFLVCHGEPLSYEHSFFKAASYIIAHDMASVNIF
jgi:hypothetical protein